MKERKSLGQLFVPLCLETLCYMLAEMVDTLMLSTLGDAAVGAVGTAATYISVFVIMFSIISYGMMAVMTQYIGAGKMEVAGQARRLSTFFNAGMGIVLSLFLLRFSGAVLELVGVADSLMGYAKAYLGIVGGSCVLYALIPVFSGYLRAFGYTKEPLTATIMANIVNFVLNALFLFRFHWGVRGVASATVISYGVNLLLVICYAHRLIRIPKTGERLKNSQVFFQILKIGLPSAAETALYNVAMTLIIRFLNQMDPEGLNVTARSYTMQITNFAYSVGAALAQANAILTGWHVGAKQYDACDAGTRKAARIGIGVAVFLESLLAIFSGLIMRIFTDDPVMIALVGRLLTIDIVLEIGRVSNLVFGQALKASGDAVYPTIIAAIFMYLCAVGGTYFFGIRLGWLAAGAYVGLALDECVRAVCMYRRWKKGKWRTRGLVAEQKV